MINYIAEVVAFLIIVAILVRWKPNLPITLPTIRAALAKQQELIAQQVKDAEEAKKKLADAERSYQNGLHEARTEAAQIRENARAEAQRTLEDLQGQAAEESERILTRADDQLTTQRSAVVRDLRAEIGALAVELAEKIVDQRLAEQSRVSSTVDAFLADLESSEKASSRSRGAGGSTS